MTFLFLPSFFSTEKTSLNQRIAARSRIGAGIDVYQPGKISLIKLSKSPLDKEAALEKSDNSSCRRVSLRDRLAFQHRILPTKFSKPSISRNESQKQVGIIVIITLIIIDRIGGNG